MRSAEQLISIAVGRSKLADISPVDHARWGHGLFKMFDVDLPVGHFRGFPPAWRFAVLDLSQVGKRTTPAEFNAAARDVIISSRREDAMSARPLVLISDDDSWRLGDEFTIPGKPVLCLDAADLPVGGEVNVPAQVAPLVLSFRRILHSVGATTPIWASPYQPFLPVNGWRFFGRKQELRLLVETDGNYVIVGARRSGKSSLMQEAARLLKANGETVYDVDVQECTTSDEVVARLLARLSPRDMVNAGRRAELLHESVFAQVLKRMTAQGRRPILMLDEIGNVIRQLPQEDWRFLGLLRKYGQEHRLRFMISCFQEVFLRQAQDFSGPLVNFATPMPLGLFSDAEVEEFLLGPLEIWQNLENTKRHQLFRMTLSVVGRHPLMLQVFGRALMEQAALTDEGPDFLDAAQRLLRRDLVPTFRSVIDEVFQRIPSAAIMYLFASRCLEASAKGDELLKVEITEEWVERALLAAGYESTFAGRRNLLEGLQVHGLTAPTDFDPLRQSIASPVVWLYLLKTVGSPERFLTNLAKDMRREHEAWGLEPIQAESGSGR